MQTTNSTCQPAKKPTALLIFCGVILAALLLVLGVLIFRAQSRRTPSRTAALSAVTVEQMQRPVLEGDGVSLNNTMLQYYYWSQYYYHVNALSEEAFAAFRATDAYNDSMTWEDFFLSSALTTMRETAALCAAADAAGFAMPEEFSAALENTLTRFSTYAEANGFTKDGAGDVDAYLQASYGPCADTESFRRYLRDSFLATAYADTIYADAPQEEDARYEYYRNAVETAVGAMHFAVREENIVIAVPSLADESAESADSGKDSQNSH